MIIKLSHIALAVFASVSFSAAAETLVADKVATADADVIVRETATLGITITPTANLTVDDVKKGGNANLASFKLIGDKAAVRFLNADKSYPYCTTSSGEVNPQYQVEFCLDKHDGSFNINGVNYYKYNPGVHNIRGGRDNLFNNVGADTYKISMEAVQYTL